jgi:hypothetical protein
MTVTRCAVVRFFVGPNTGVGPGVRSCRTMDALPLSRSSCAHASPQISPFRTQTGQNINVAAHGIAKLIGMMLVGDD